MLAEGLALWDELEKDSGEQLLARTGVVNHGPDPQLAHAGRAHPGRPPGRIPAAAEAAERWRGIRFDQQVLYMPDGGQLNPEAALPAFQRLAAPRRRDPAPRQGGGLKITRRRRPAHRGRRRADRGGDRPPGRGDRRRLDVEAACRPVGNAAADGHPGTAGALRRRRRRRRLAGIQPLPGIARTTRTGTRPSTACRPRARASRPAGTGWARWWIRTGGPSCPSPASWRRCRSYARHWLPGVDADSMTDISCTYTTTPDENFVLDRIGPVVIGAGFSGHGFKFTPVVGRILRRPRHRRRPGAGNLLRHPRQTPGCSLPADRRAQLRWCRSRSRAQRMKPRCE